jgi:Xaa-Pro dipeptidase
MTDTRLPRVCLKARPWLEAERPMSPAEARYAAHVSELGKRAATALALVDRDHLLLAAGVPKYRFLDDMPYPFHCNPHFRQWLPLTDHAHCWLAITPGDRPHLIYHLPVDFWHVVPGEPAGYWTEQFKISIIRQPEEALDLLPPADRCAIVGEPDAALPGYAPDNAARLLACLDWHRGSKTGHEIDLMRAANRRAVPGHLAAAAAFGAGASEHEIHHAYLEATGHRDNDLPYGSIVALDRNCAVLHYQHQSRLPPQLHGSLLIDAGAAADGYAADITRTWAAAPGAFADLVAAVDAVQQQLAQAVTAGTDFADLHLHCHLLLAGVLRQCGILRIDADVAVARGITAAFFPHGLGHLIGTQVHDVGGLQAGPDGGRIERPPGHPYLRLTRRLQPGMAVTIEPGIYFIDSLLQPLRDGPDAAAIDWPAVAALRPYGGIRIEDDVVCTEGEAENLTRDAFASGPQRDR